MSLEPQQQRDLEDAFSELVETIRILHNERGLTIFQIQEALEEALDKSETEVLKELL